MKTLSAFSQRLDEKTAKLRESLGSSGDQLSEEKRQALDHELNQLIGHTSLEFIPVGLGGIFLKRETDNPSETHYDRAFSYLITEFEGKGTGRYKQRPRIRPSV